MLRELDVPFETVLLDRARGDLDMPWFREVSPAGQIPVLLDRGRPICESAAIVVYLADKFIDRGLIPIAGTFERAIHDQWLFTTLTELEAPLWDLHRQVNRGEGDEAAGALARRRVEAAARRFEAQLNDRDYLMGDVFAAVDVVLGHLVTWAVMQPLLTQFDALSAYRTRITARSAFPSALYEDE